jgi:hypothetical protein
MKTGKKHYLKNYNFHEILTCLSHGYKNIGQNNILSLIKIYFNGMWTIILFIINQRYNPYICSCIPNETILKPNWLVCVIVFYVKHFLLRYLVVTEPWLHKHFPHTQMITKPMLLQGGFEQLSSFLVFLGLRP